MNILNHSLASDGIIHRCFLPYFDRGKISPYILAAQDELLLHYFTFIKDLHSIHGFYDD